MTIRMIAVWTLALTFPAAAGIPARGATRLTRIDANGVLRWEDNGAEVALFGVNYYPPFALDYTRLKAQGIDHKAAIRQDVAHFVRLGLSSIRLHCWDREISDRQGNLVDNIHLDLLDYLLARCKENGIYALLTPIAWWPSGTGKAGFSNFWPMRQMTSNPEAWKAETTYLRQFVMHVNRYTGLAYRDDPVIIGFETINEPIYPPGLPDAKVVEYINTLVRAIRSTGCRKPIFHSFFSGRLKAVGASEADGITFGWYPTGLTGGKMRTGNFLPLVDDYPAMRDPALAGKVIAVYEFDAADVQAPYMYPAIARTFRSGGCQIANQFQYDPLCIAAGNPDWQTHYLNLCYTPKKAISFAIAAEVFRRIPRKKRFGPYPAGNRFGPFRVNYGERLSELAARDAFMYSNDTKTLPPQPSALRRVWGCGSSPVVTYTGTGAYFLDKQRAGVWLLEVYPDAVMVADPYTGGIDEKVRILWAEHEMDVKLPDLGPRFYVRPANRAAPGMRAETGRFRVRPGRYLLCRDRRGGAVVDAPFIAPPSSTLPPAVFLQAGRRWREGVPAPVRASVAALGVRACDLYFRPSGGSDFIRIAMKRTGPYQWNAEVPAALLVPGDARYDLAVHTGKTYRFPGGRVGLPPGKRPPFPIMTVPEETRPPRVRYSGPKGKTARAKIVPGRHKGDHALHVEADGFGPPPSCAGVDWPIHARPKDAAAFTAVQFTVRGGPDTPYVEIGFPQKDGRAFGFDVPMWPKWHTVTVPIWKLKPLWKTPGGRPDFTRLDHISIIFGAWLFRSMAARKHWVEIQSVELISRPSTWQVHVCAEHDPVVLLDAAARRLRMRGGRCQASLVPGKDVEVRAWRFDVSGFGPAPNCRTLRVPVEPEVDALRSALSTAKYVLLTARAGVPRSDAVELTLIEKDGAPWGTVAPLSSQWQTLRIPLSRLHYFGHWNPPCKKRGGKGDRFHPENVSMVNLCFGAFLYPKKYSQPHAIEIQRISLGWEKRGTP